MNKTFFNSLSMALLIAMNYILAIMKLDNGIVICVLAILLLQTFAQKSIKLSLKIIFFSLAILLFFMISMLISGSSISTTENLYKFIIFGLLSLYLTNTNFNIQKIYEIIIVIGFFTIPQMLTIDFQSIIGSYMAGLSYALLPILLSAIIGISKKGILRIFSLGIIISSILVLGKIAPRGVWLSIAFFLCFYSIRLFFVATWKRYFCITGLIISALIISMNAKKIIEYLYTFFLGFGFYVYSLSKSLQYINKDIFFSDRLGLWNAALNGFKMNPLFGNGIGTFEKTHGVYPHNIFLQVIWDGGIIWFIVIFSSFISALNKIIRGPIQDKTTFILFLFSLSFISLLFSSSLWMNQYLWILIGLQLKSVTLFGRKDVQDVVL